MGINGIEKIFNAFKSAQRFENAFLRGMDKLSKTSKRIHSPRITFDKHNLSELPRDITELTQGLRNPRIVAGINCGKGKSILGVRIQDGDEIVGQFAFNFRQNKGGSPSTQVKLQLFNQEQKAMSSSFMLNPNGTTKGDFVNAVSSRNGVMRIEQGRGDAIQLSGFFNPEQAAPFLLRTGVDPKVAVKKIQQIQAHPDKFLKELLASFTKSTEGLATTTTKATKSVNERTFATEVEQIMKFEGNPTVESANKAKDILMKRMGYDPSLVTVKISDDIAGCGGGYNKATGEVLLDASMVSKATHFDVADVLVHELDHMDVAVKTAKSIGLDNYERLIMYRSTADDLEIYFNRAFYEKAIAQADITGFNFKPFLQEEKQLNRLFDQNLTGQYSTIMRKYQYAISKKEGHARDVEKVLIAELQRRGIEVKSVIRPDGFGVTPNEHLVQIMPKIEAKLAQYPLAQRNRKFNKAFYKALEEINPEYARLEAKSYKGLSHSRINKNGTVEQVDESKRYDDLWEEIFGNGKEEAVETKILERTLELI